MHNETVDGFIELFQGGLQAWGAVHGGAVKERVTRDTFVHHLYGEDGSIGIYPLRAVEDVPPNERPSGFASDSLVRWGCTDIDNEADPESTLVLAKNIRSALAYMGIVSWVERTKGKGHHVWMFLDHWQRPAWVRNVLLLAHKVAGVTPSEVNPKQVTRKGTEKGLGNYVNLPYAANRQPGKREIICAEEGNHMSLRDFVPMALKLRTDATAIETWAARWVPPAPPQRVMVDTTLDRPLQEIVDRLRGVSRKIWDEGPLPPRDGKPGRGRFVTLQRLAMLMAEQGFTPAETFAVVWACDGRMDDPKFHPRVDGEDQVELMVSRAFTPRG